MGMKRILFVGEDRVWELKRFCHNYLMQCVMLIGVIVFSLNGFAFLMDSIAFREKEISDILNHNLVKAFCCTVLIE